MNSCVDHTLLVLRQGDSPTIKTRRCVTCSQDVESSAWKQHLLAHSRYTRRAHMLSLGGGPTVRMMRGPGRHRTTKPPNHQHLRRGRALGRRLAPLALSVNSYATLKRYADESMDDETKDFVIGALLAVGAILNASYGLVSVPLG